MEEVRIVWADAPDFDACEFLIFLVPVHSDRLRAIASRTQDRLFEPKIGSLHPSAS